MSDLIEIGSTIIYRPSFGTSLPIRAVVEGIEQSPIQRQAYGTPVDSILFSKRHYGCFSLKGDTWCYGNQVDALLS